MPSKAEFSCSYCNRYTTFRFLIDHERDITAPVGVAVWNAADTSSLHMRLPNKSDRFKGVSVKEVVPYLKLVTSQIEGWIKRKELPYASDFLEPLSDAWWNHVQKLLYAKVRIDVPKPIECLKPEEEVEALYEAVAKPHQQAKHRKTRIESTLRNALDDTFAKKVQFRTSVPGFKEKPVEVLGAIQLDDARVVLEVVNLAGADAEKDADALASRILRIKEGSDNNLTRFVIGYIASPNGLNGETHMKEWVEQKSNTRLYDMCRELELFNSMLSSEYNSAGLLAMNNSGLFRGDVQPHSN